MLEFLRESVYDGSIPKPKPKLNLPSSLPTMPAAMRKMVLDTNSVSSSPKPFEDPEIEVMRRMDLDVRPKVNKIEAVHVLWPTPYATYSHTRDCFHSPLRSFSTRNGVKNRTVSPNVSLISAPSTVRILTSRSALFHLDAKHTAKMAQLRQLSFRQWDSGDYDDGIEIQIREMREEVTASRLAKGIFFRRCDGSYVNCLGWVWEDEEDEVVQKIAADGDNGQKSTEDTLAIDTKTNSNTIDREITPNTANDCGQSTESSSNGQQSEIDNLDTSSPSNADQPKPPASRAALTSHRLRTRENLRHYQFTDHTSFNTAQAADEDLIITCWVWQRQNHNHRHPSVKT